MLGQFCKNTFFPIFQKMGEPNVIREIMLDPVNANPDPIEEGLHIWNELALSEGYPGLVLLFANLKIKDEDKTAIIHHYLLKIKESLETKGCHNLSLFSGISGICFALQQASCSGKRYRHMLNTLHAYLLGNMENMFLGPIRSNLYYKKSTFAHFFDPIQGICGIGRYALTVKDDPRFLELIHNVLHLLVQLSHPLEVDGKLVPGWYSSPEDPLNHYHNSSPKGNFNLGLAHGVTGILAFLTIAFLQGVEVKGQQESIHRIATWICEKSIQISGVIQWPYHVSWEEEVEKIFPASSPSRDAWCYGVPGIARILFLAGKALKNESLKEFALRSYNGIFYRTPNEWDLQGPTLCHGIAGLLWITHVMAQEEEGKSLRTKVEELKDLLLSFFNSEAPFGFQDSEPSKSLGIVQINKVGYLEGSVGVLLALDALSNSETQCHLPLMIHA